MLKTILCAALVFPLAGRCEKDKKEECPFSETVVTKPSPVNIDDVIQAVLELKSTQSKMPLISNTGIGMDIRDVFDTDKIKTKMEQFYTLLFVINKYLPRELGKDVFLDPQDVKNILLKSSVFTDMEIPKHIHAVSVSRNHFTEPKYTISFDQEATEVSLNKGEGFYLYRNGLCQQAKKLFFKKDFSVIVRKNSKQHIVATDFHGVDLFGRFGNRGIIDVDINYVSLRSVEFFKGTPNGKVTAYVSREEFKKNDHNFLLRMITSYVGDQSVQPIDW